MFGFGKENNKQKVSTESYKGVRDFYPEDKRVRDYIFNTWAKVVESFGYESYDASIIEPLELYKSKSSEEIVNEQIYSFKDRGDREVALRPEMTPTVARMIAGKINETPFPARWYSIPNVFRYEKPQRGRLREHWQLNVDLFGPNSVEADTEIITIGSNIMKAFRATEADFEIRINSRSLMNNLYEKLEIPMDKWQTVSRIIDKKEKISGEAFAGALTDELGETGARLRELLESGEGIFEMLGETEQVQRLNKIINMLWDLDIRNVKFVPYLTRGFDYYTGIIFEIFDTNKENPRSIFGGGRYDNLLAIFSDKKMPAVGFGLGDLTMRDFLETHNLLPKFENQLKIWICPAPGVDMTEIYKISQELREKGISNSIDLSDKKLGEKIAGGEKRGVPYVLIIGNDEISNKKYKLKIMTEREEKELSLEEIVSMVR